MRYSIGERDEEGKEEFGGDQWCSLYVDDFLVKGPDVVETIFINDGVDQKKTMGVRDHTRVSI